MNFLILMAFLPCPFWILDFILSSLQISPPVWVSDVMVISLILSGLGMIASFLRRGKPAVPKAESIGTRCSCGDFTGPAAPSQGDDWDKILPGFFHEIRNYSSTLRGNTELLRRHSLSSSMLEPLGRMERSAAKIEYLAKELLEASSMTHLTYVSSIGIPELIEGCIQDHFPEARGSFDLRIASDIPPIEADFLKLERVFLNLFRNAREAGANQILVRVAASPDRMRIAVEDDGKGCSVDQIGMLFRPLFTTRKAHGGTGLGLYMVKAILESHGGGIRAESKNASIGKGSGMVFTMELPITQSRSGCTIARNPFRMSSVGESI
jgi:nitrogen-specific signal transduction histidine kinase